MAGPCVEECIQNYDAVPCPMAWLSRGNGSWTLLWRGIRVCSLVSAGVCDAPLVSQEELIEGVFDVFPVCRHMLGHGVF